MLAYELQSPDGDLKFGQLGNHVFGTSIHENTLTTYELQFKNGSAPVLNTLNSTQIKSDTARVDFVKAKGKPRLMVVEASNLKLYSPDLKTVEEKKLKVDSKKAVVQPLSVLLLGEKEI